MSDMIAYFETRIPLMLDLLTELVRRESPSDDKAAVDAVITYVGEAAQARGAASIERFPLSEVGDCLLAKWNPDAEGQPILFICHQDTVHPIGSLAKMPIRVDDGKFYGPGALDMKAGTMLALETIEGLRARGDLPARPIWLLATSDEEIGTHHCEPIIERAARQAALVLCMEPAAVDEALKIQRKGVAGYDIEIVGRASHAGNAPEQGVNAIIAFAQQALRLNALNDLRRGTSVSVTTVQGGTKSNVIPAHVRAEIDVRFITVQTMHNLHEQIMDAEPHLPGSVVNIALRSRRPPMEFNDQMRRDFEQAQQIGAALGLTVRGESVGGGSDGSLTAAWGIPTLDGMGATGTGMHADDEQVWISSLARRAALIAGILRGWA